MEQLKITKETSINKITLSIKGTINTDNAKELNEVLLELDYNDLDLTLDFSKTDYITSAGLRALLVARKKLPEGRMRIIHANASIEEVFKTTGFDAFIKLESGNVSEENYRLSLAALLRKHAKDNPEDTAFIYKDRKYTWQDIDVFSHIVADDLSKQGVKKGTHVGICSKNSINWVLILFAIQKLGGVAVLVNPALGPNEILTMTEIGEITHLCYSEIPGITNFNDISEICLKGPFTKHTYDISDSIDFGERASEYDGIKSLYCENHHADDACTIIFSSGSTGRPKAILSSAFNLTSSLEPIINEWQISKNDINMAFLPMFHVFGFATGISLGLLTGNYSVIPESRSPNLIMDRIAEYKCTFFATVPTMILAMIQMPTFTPSKLSSLRVSILGGSATTEEQMSMLMTILPNTHFGNIYGMSENAAVSLSVYNDTISHITSTVGKPVPGLELEIRDVSTGKALSPGNQGEICVRSNSMVVCYYKLPIEKQPVDDEGWLTTGDLGFIDDEGYLHLTGRIKDLIICGGENISPGEIADVLSKIPEISDVKVVGVPDNVYGEVVTAAVIIKSGEVFDENNVRDFAAKNLAKYKRPVHYVVFDSFPMLGSGKVDAITLKKKVAEAVASK